MLEVRDDGGVKKGVKDGEDEGRIRKGDSVNSVVVRAG